MRCYIELNKIQVDVRIFKIKFSCDYEKCKGACCNQPIPDLDLIGGALSDYEAAEILYHREELSVLCDEENREDVIRKPVTKFGEDFFTSLRGSKCVLCNMKQGICALKLAKDKGITSVDIPLSCQLYPIVWQWKVHENQEILTIGDTFDKDYCEHAYTKGKRDNVYLLDFMKVPLIRGFGEDFYNKLKEIQKEFI